MVEQVRRYHIYLVNLDPARGSEIQKMRPCVVISPDEMNQYIRTVIVAPMTSTQRDYPSRINVTFQRKKGQVVLDQIRTVDKSRLVRRLGVLPDARAREVADVLREMFAYGSIASDQNSISLSSEQKAELDKRLVAYEVTEHPGRPVDEVISEIRKKL